METFVEITLFNAVKDTASRTEVFKPTLTSRASYLEGKGSSQGTGGTWTSDLNYKIRIPYSAELANTYTPEEIFAGIGWTLRKGDFILLGHHEVENMGKTQLTAYAKEQGLSLITITEYADNTLRGAITRHWRIGGK